MADGCGASIFHRLTSGQPSRPHYPPYRFSPAIIKVAIFCTGFLSCHILHIQLDIQQVSSPSLAGIGGVDLAGSVKTNDNVTLCGEEKVKKNLSSKSDGVEKLPLGIIERTSDFYLRRLWGDPEEDLQDRQRGLLAMTAGIGQKANVDLIISKFPAHMFSLIIFHYDNILDWQGSEWSDRAIHVAAKGQTKWWFTKRFLTPNVVSAYDYIFIWDEDVTVNNFNGLRYMEIMDKYKLEISQPALGGASRVHYPFTRRVDDAEVHFRTDLSHKGFDCSGGNVNTPCAGFVEVMVPVFATSVWTCVWHMLQNDLVHCWGVDFHLGECTSGPRHEKMAVVDSEWIVHSGVQIMGGKQGAGGNELTPARNVIHLRGSNEWGLFENRWIQNLTTLT